MATLVVRQFGFDMAGLPDDDDDRRAAIRSTLGNLRRESEALFRARGEAPVVTTDEIPRVPILGWK